MNHWLFTIPLFTALAGWIAVWFISNSLFYPEREVNIAGIKLQGFLYRYKSVIISAIADYADTKFSFTETLENKLNHPQTLEKIMPVAEEHIDYFLRKKLVEQMPMIGMLIGEKTILQFKEIFIKELNELFPVIIKNFSGSLSADLNIKKHITEKLSEADTFKLIAPIQKGMAKQLRKIQLAGFLIGFLIGIIQLILFLQL